MATSQFTIYQSSDAGAPQLSGTSGSLTAVLEAVLVTGYGSKLSAGWLKPFAATSPNTASCYQQVSGSGKCLYVNDGQPGGGGYREAWITGWETMTSTALPVGTGNGQFPTPSQQLTNGHLVVRKSSALDSTPRYWMIVADASTFYMFVATLDTVGVYYAWMFGDVFSLKGSSDTWKCMIQGRTAESSTGPGSIYSNSHPMGSDTFDMSADAVGNTSYQNPLAWPLAGHFMARNSGGTGGSITLNKLFDTGKSGLVCYFGNSWIYGNTAMLGFLPTPNPIDNTIYVCPVSILESSTGAIRGRWRGIYQICHPAANFADGQTFQGGGDFAGKTFMVVKLLISGAGFCAVEISNTVETN